MTAQTHPIALTNPLTPPHARRGRLVGLLLGLLGIAALAVDPNWTPVGTLDTMAVHARVQKPDGTFITFAGSPGSRLGAFKGAECRGSEVIIAGTTGGQWQLSVGSDTSGETGITMKVWDAVTDRIYDIDATLTVVHSTTIGAYGAPVPYTLEFIKESTTPPEGPQVISEGAAPAFEITVGGGEEAYSYAWTVNGVPAGGNLPTFTYTTDVATVAHPATSAAKTVACTVTDANLNPVSASWAVTVNDVDQAPTAPVVDIDQAAPTTTAALTYSSTTPATDADSDAITYVTSWTNGTTTLSTLGLAAANTRKGETWTVTVFARTNPYGLGNIDSAVDTDAVVIQNTSPVAVAPTVPPVPAFSSNNVLPVLDGTDADETDGVDTLTFAILNGPLGALRTAEGGTLSSFNPATGAVQYTPATGFSGNDSFQFTVTDGTATSAAATVSISVFPPLMEIAVSGAGVDTIELGADALATDSADEHLDHLAPPHYEGIGSVRFISPGDGEFLKRDLRPDFTGERFQIEIRAGETDAVILAWDPTDLIIPAGLGWHLWQLDGLNGDPIPGTAIDMSLVTQTVAVPADPEGDDAPVYFEIGVPGTVTLTLVSPATGLPAGGTLVTLTGTGFLPGAAVTFGGDAGTAVTVAPAGTTLTVLTPARVFSLVAVTVTNGDGGAATLPNAFRYNTAPTANAGGPYTVDLCASLTLNGSASADADTANGDVLTYAWDLDDDGAYDDAAGAAPTVLNATIVGLGIGPHTIRLQVSDSASVLATAATTLTLTNALPVASHTGPYRIDLGSNLLLNASASTDANTACGDVLTYAWDLDNDGVYGEASEPTTATATVTAATLATLGFPTASPFTGLPKRTIRVRVSDANGGVATASTTVTIYQNTPVADFTVTPAGGHAEFDEVVRFDPAPSYHGSPLHSIVTYEWDFNYDGSFNAMQTTTTETHVGYIFGSFGTFTVALRVTDDNPTPTPVIATRTVIVDQGNNPPTVDAGGPYSIAVTTALTLAGSGTDPDLGFGDTLTYAWDLDNDGAYDDATGPTPTLSAAAVTALGLPENVANTIRVRVTDFGLLTAVDTATLTLTNDPDADPTAWLFTFDVEFGSEAQLRIGVNPAATNLEDAAFDRAAGLSTLSGAFSAVHPSPTAANELSTAINRSNVDVDGDGDTDTYADWLIELSAGVNAPLVLTWDSARVPAVGMWLIEVPAPALPALIPDVDARIPAGTPRIDMSQEDTLVIGLGETRFFRVIYGFLDFDLPLAEGWNMFALPVEPFDTAIAAVLTDGLPELYFPNSIYGYDSATGAYVDATDLRGLPGYWVYAMRDAAVTVRGIRISDRKYDLAGTEKWHMVGVAAARALETNANLWLPGYWWNAAVGQYETVLVGETLVPGVAYWFYGLAPTQLNP